MNLRHNDFQRFLSFEPTKNLSKTYWKTGLVFGNEENNVIEDFIFKSSGVPKI